MSRDGLTTARRNGLRAFRARDDGHARESNVTQASRDDPTVYWQTRAWLSQHGYIEPSPTRPGWYRLTRAGIELAKGIDS